MRWWSLLILLAAFGVCYGQQRVRLRDVTTLTLHRGAQTTGRRSAPVPQLQCIGGTASGRHAPKVVQCYNRGFDGLDVQWECTADMPTEYQFGRVAVTCEGYDSPNDPYVLAGSCGLKYELDYSKQGAYKKTTFGDNSEGWFNNVVMFVVVCGILFVLYYMFSGGGGGPADRARGGGFYGGGGGGGGGGPDAPGWRPHPSAPPSYDEATKPGASASAGTAWGGPGFWTGLGLGGLGGYMFGRGQDGHAYRRRPYATQFERDTGFYDTGYSAGPSRHDEPGPSTSSHHTSSGFGGTERR